MLQRSVARTELVDLTPAAARRGQAIGWLGDGTAYFAPLGELPYDPTKTASNATSAASGFAASAADT